MGPPLSGPNGRAGLPDPCYDGNTLLLYDGNTLVYDGKVRRVDAARGIAFGGPQYPGMQGVAPASAAWAAHRRDGDIVRMRLAAGRGPKAAARALAAHRHRTARPRGAEAALSSPSRTHGPPPPP
eukprot:gene25212-33214_t